jgi:SAM-dependent methyltransferase
MRVTTRPQPLLDYIAMAPLPLALERSLEADIYSRLTFERPILDVGCGEGLFAKLVFDEPIDTGIDPNPRELARARELGGYRELIQCEGSAVPKPDGSYQTVFSNSVLEHIQELEPVLAEIHRLLARDGRLYVTVPSERFEQFSVGSQLLNGIGLHAAARRYRAFYNDFWAHYHCYPIARWETLVRAAGFEVIDSFTYAPLSVCLVDDLLVPASLGSFFVKRLTNRWTLLPALRRKVLYPTYLLGRRLLAGASEVADGGLVFMALRKVS